MSEISILAVILGKNSFQVCGVQSDVAAVFDQGVLKNLPLGAVFGT